MYLLCEFDTVEYMILEKIYLCKNKIEVNRLKKEKEDRYTEFIVINISKKIAELIDTGPDVMSELILEV